MNKKDNNMKMFKPFLGLIFLISLARTALVYVGGDYKFSISFIIALPLTILLFIVFLIVLIKY